MNAEQMRRWQHSLRLAARYKAEGERSTVIGLKRLGRWQYFVVPVYAVEYYREQRTCPR